MEIRKGVEKDERIIGQTGAIPMESCPILLLFFPICWMQRRFQGLAMRPNGNSKDRPIYAFGPKLPKPSLSVIRPGLGVSSLSISPPLHSTASLLLPLPFQTIPLASLLPIPARRQTLIPRPADPLARRRSPMCRWGDAIARAVVAFLDAVLVGCFLSYFRPRPGPVSGQRGPLVPKDRPREVLSDDEQGFRGSRGSHDDLADHGGGVDEELMREANYLKLCGTISETPAELRDVSYQINLQNTNEWDNMPANATEETSVFEVNSSEGFKCEEDHTLRPELNIEDTEHLPRVESVPRSAFQEKSPFQSIKNRLPDCIDSPFPTPLVLRDDMETPGTIYTSHIGASMSGKRVRTHKQFVYPVLRPIENKFKWMGLKEDSSPMLPSNPPKRRNLGVDSFKKAQQTSSDSVATAGLSKSLPFSFPNDNVSYQEKEALSLEESKCQIGSPNLLDGGELSKSNSDEKHAVLSLSHWLKPSSADDENQGDVKCPAGDQWSDKNSLFIERPVLTASEINWDVENPTPRLPKAWDGNGIPNTTTKYKEDQKVSWHATPFEERLSKVLSDPDPPRKLVRGRLFHVD